MDLSDTPEQAAYRAQVRAWIEQHKHAAPPRVQGLHVEDIAPYRAWMGKLAQQRLVGVTWPKEYGGAGLGPVEHLIVAQELKRADCAGIIDHIAISELGPALIAFGSEEQKQRYLGPMLHGDEGWCQLFSEPAAGSDLAGVQTRAKPVSGGGWRISGQKVWTTLAHFADYGLLLARTDPDVPKHKGLTMFIVPMKAPGVTVRPLRQTSGKADFNEVFFDDVEIAADAAVGPVDGGWQVAVVTLMFERMGVLASFEEMAPAPEALLAPLADHPAAEDARVRAEVAQITVDLLSLRYLSYRSISALSQGQVPGPEAGLAKITLVEAASRGAQLLCDALGPDALDEHGDYGAELLGLRSAAGTDEIVRTTIGDRVLGLPSEPRLDKDRPFSELGRSEVAA